MEPTKLISVRECDFNTLTLIAKKNGFLYPEGHKDAGKMNSRQAVEYLIKNFSEPIA